MANGAGVPFALQMIPGQNRNASERERGRERERERGHNRATMRSDGINRETESIVPIHRAFPWETRGARVVKKKKKKKKQNDAETLSLDNVEFGCNSDLNKKRVYARTHLLETQINYLYITIAALSARLIAIE